MNVAVDSEKQHFRVWQIALVSLLFLAAYWGLYRLIGNPAMAIDLVPMFFIARWYGRWIGVMVAFGVLPVNLALFYLFGGEQGEALVGIPFWAASVALPVLAYEVGLNSELRTRLRGELAGSRSLVKQLREERDRVRRTSQSKDELLMSISHDLRTPVSAIIQLAQGLQADPNPEHIPRQMQLIENSGHQLLDIISDLLAGYGKESTPRSQSAPFDLHGLVEDIVQQQAPLFQAKGLTLQLRWDNRLPKWVHGHPKSVRRILINLLANSLKYTHEGGAVLEVALFDSDSAAPRLQITVEDSGIGIPADKIKALLIEARDPPSPNLSLSGEHGYGLGLGNCLRMADDIGAELSLEPNQPHGLRAVLEKPLRAASTPETRAVQAATLPSAPSGLRVLVVDDDPVSAESLANILATLGATTRIAHAGYEAEALLASGATDLAFVDLQLPDIDGVHLAHRLRTSSPETTLILFSANVLLTDRDQWLDEAIDFILSKPISTDELAEVCRLATAGKASGAGQPPAVVDVPAEPLTPRQRQLLDEYLESCLFAFGCQDFDSCTRHAHKLASATRTLGLTHLTEEAVRIETHARQGSRLELFDALRRLTHLHNKLLMNS